MIRMTPTYRIALLLALVVTVAAGCGMPTRRAEPASVDGPASSLAPAPAPDAGPAPDAAPLPADGGWTDIPLVEAGVPTQVSKRVGAPSLDPFYDRVAADLIAGKPLVTTVYVALCDNDSQGIVPVRNRSICNGDDPGRNMYWIGSGGLAGWARKHRWKKVHREDDGGGPVLIEQVWRKRFKPGRGLKARGVRESYTAYVIGRAYRGREIHRGMADYLHAVHHDEPLVIELDGESISGGGAGHLVGYQGHDYIMDVLPGSPELADLRAQMGGDSTLPKGAFALACAGDSYIRSGITRPNVYVMLLNVYLAFPNAWAIGGVLDGIAQGGDGRAVYRAGARGFAAGQECGLGWALKAFAHGPNRKATK